MDYCIIIHGVHNSNSAPNADTVSGLQPRWGATINQVMHKLPQQRVGCLPGGVSTLKRFAVGDGERDSEERGAVLSGTRQVQEKKR